MRPQTVPVEMRHLRTSPLSGQASTSSLLVPDTLGLPLRGSVRGTMHEVGGLAY